MEPDESDDDDDEPSRGGWIESTIKVAGAIVGICTLVYSIFVYLDTRGLEARRPLLEAQFDLYQEAVAVAGRLATVQCAGTDQDCIAAYHADCKRFRSLYWGDLAVVEDKRVEQAMIAFRNVFSERHPGFCDPDSIDATATSPKSPGNPMALASLDLAHCVNASLQSGWGAELLPDRCDFAVAPTLSRRDIARTEK